MYILMLNSMFLSLMFLTLNNPMSLGLILLIQTILISLMSSFLTYSFWMSYILFLVMVGGMLILFTYMTSLAPNEMFLFSNKTLMMLIISFTFFSLMFFITDKTFLYQMFKNSDMMNMLNSSSLIKENMIILNKIYNKPNNLISIMLINYLFLTLIIVVKITNIKYGPIRQKF
uniref:NADH-ubiquinone oxidoreductase chain 6 n=1 Tax=Scirtidae sp. GENSP02 TaxID=1205581 RepID=A0A0S2MN39_9COLE|nr:NADH deshydrogenase subunit 6 [Scirtidae sp. GENSP02]